ncbi:TonB-dependent receptor [Pseudoblastomonas halimionae]|uniref:TonB-dependent receptor n=1 Tax=Alteriqipengyuania halimionae TaxID=1926630 RepID=A0A6I4U434_9SPHN|nr:TonB-dependent receptor [Alteriqipengyuania halimionae]MXP09211.1 TonB-dependent receptor [Alteriqipengyuania halimionae]
MKSEFYCRALCSASALALLSTPALAQSDEASTEQDPSATQESDENRVTIIGTLESREMRSLDTPALGVAIDADQIAAINTINAEDVIRYAPNLIVRKRYIGDANATLSFRNMHTTQTPRALVTVDGFLISDFLGASFGTAPKWAVLSPTDIARAEIIYGPTSARYAGNSLGGTLRLETAPIDSNAISLGAQRFYQNYKYYDTDENLYGFSVNGQADIAIGSRGGVSVAYRHFENEGQPQQWRTVSPGTPFADQAIVDSELGFPLRIAAQDSVVDSVEDQFRLRGNYDLGGGWELRGLAALLIDDETTDDPNSFLRDADGEPTFVGISGVTRGQAQSTELLAGLGLAGNVAGWDVDLSVSRFELLDERARQSNGVDVTTGIIPDSGIVTDEDAHWTSVETSAERAFGAHRIALGASYAGYFGASETGAVADWRTGEPTAIRNASGGETQLAGVFLEDTITLAPMLEATLGLRYENWRASGGFLQYGPTRVDYASRNEDAWSPKLALTLQPDDATEIVASAAWATRFPTIGELYQAGLISYGPNVGEIDLDGFDPNLAPERGFDLQLTASRRFDNVKVTLSGFRQAVDDTLFSQTILVPGADDPSVPVSQSLITNIGEVETWGVDAIVAVEDMFVEGLSLDANVSWIDAIITENPLNPALEGNRFPRVPRWRANASLRYAVSPMFDLAANLRYQSTPERNLENNASSRCDTYYCVSPFTFVDLKSTVHFDGFDLDLGIDNVFDEKAFVFHPYPGRTFVIGLRWNGGF